MGGGDLVTISSGPSGTGGAGGGGATSVGSTGGNAPAPDTLSVATINLQTFVLAGNAEERTQIVADAINALEPDVVALQEVAQSLTEDNRGEVLADLTGYQLAWSIAHDAGVYQEGTAVLSRWPMTWQETVELPHGDLGGQAKRLTVGAGIDTPYGPVSFFSSHATLDSDEEKKADQAAASHALVLAHDGGEPAFLCGDMNATPDTLAMRFLRGAATHQGTTGDYVDAWMSTHPGDPGFTNPSDAPEKRIDYVYARGATEASSCELILADPVNGLRASDHLGVLCHFAMR